jgi:hypothetical protein
MGIVPHINLSECNDICNNKTHDIVGKCNVSGTWSIFSADIINACEYTETFRFPPIELNGTIYKNKFCAICNPFKSNHTEIPCIKFPESSSVVKACHDLPSIDVCFPYRNVFCEMCFSNDSLSPCYGEINICNVHQIVNVVSTRVPSIQRTTPVKVTTFRTIFSLEGYNYAAMGNQNHPACQKNQIIDEFQVKHIIPKE